MICYLFPEPTYFFFSPDAPALLYYVLISTTMIALIVGFYVFWNGRQFLLNRILLAISMSFLLWTLSNLIEWTNIHSNFILFVWSFQGVILGLIAIFCIYFIYVFLDKKDVSARIKALFITLLAPILFFTPTLYLSGFDITTCDAFKFEWMPFKIYYTLLGILTMIWIIFLLIRHYRIATSDFKKQIILMGVGIESFLFLFFMWTFLTYYLTGIGVLSDSRLEIYGLFGMVIFMIYISILIVRFKAFNVKLIATQALVWGLAILIGSQFFFIKIPTNFVLNGIGFLMTIILGQFLIKSVKKEIEQREELAKLLQQRESLVHLVTHKVKGSFTHSKYIFAGILDGSFGETNEEIKRRAKQGLESDDMGIETVDLVLNADNLQKGAVKYEMKPFDLKETVLKAIENERGPIESKGLKLETEINNEDYTITGDPFWLKEALHNLIENSSEYTPNGEIMVKLEKINDKILFSIKDTGVGINEEDKKTLFTEGGRGKESVKVNVNSTGYGLFTVKLIADAHRGRVWAESQGAGKGSTFFMELPINQ